MVEKERPLKDRTIYVPRMCDGSVVVFAGAMRGLGYNASPMPEGDKRTRELAAPHLTGDECFPQLVTLGDFLKITEEPGFDPTRTAIFMPTASGPCRFGQYASIFERTLKNLGLEGVMLVSPTFDDGYKSVETKGENLMRHIWWSLVAGDLLRKALHKVRPYERHAGDADKAYFDGLEACAQTMSNTRLKGKAKLRALRDTLAKSRDAFKAIEIDDHDLRPLIGVVGEIFCRLNIFSNEDTVRKIEQMGGEAWVSDIGEWILYSSHWEREEIKTFGNPWSLKMLKSHLTHKVLKSDEHVLHEVMSDVLEGREEPDVGHVLKLAEPYLPPRAGLGEMTLNIGKAAFLKKVGADGILDISPFSCMNAIVSEAIYPTLSKDLGGIPIRNFYFDGSGGSVDDEVEIFMELAKNYRSNKI